MISCISETLHDFNYQEGSARSLRTRRTSKSGHILPVETLTRTGDGGIKPVDVVRFLVSSSLRPDIKFTQQQSLSQPKPTMKITNLLPLAAIAATFPTEPRAKIDTGVTPHTIVWVDLWSGSNYSGGWEALELSTASCR